MNLSLADFFKTAALSALFRIICTDISPFKVYLDSLSEEGLSLGVKKYFCKEDRKCFRHHMFPVIFPNLLKSRLINFQKVCVFPIEDAKEVAKEPVESPNIAVYMQMQTLPQHLEEVSM